MLFTPIIISLNMEDLTRHMLLILNTGTPRSIVGPCQQFSDTAYTLGIRKSS